MDELGPMGTMAVKELGWKTRATGGTKGGLHNPPGKGGRLIILYVGRKGGWIKVAD